MSVIHRFMLTVSLIAAASSVSGLFYYSSNEEKKREAYFREMEESRAQGLPTFSGPYCHPDPHPRILTKIVLMTTITFFFLLFLKNPFWSIPTALMAFALFPYWYMQTQRDLAFAGSYQPVLFDQYFLNASIFDLLGGVASLILLGIQIGWIIHRASASSSGETKLP